MRIYALFLVFTECCFYFILLFVSFNDYNLCFRPFLFLLCSSCCEYLIIPVLPVFSYVRKAVFPEIELIVLIRAAYCSSGLFPFSHRLFLFPNGLNTLEYPKISLSHNTKIQFPEWITRHISRSYIGHFPFFRQECNVLHRIESSLTS